MSDNDKTTGAESSGRDFIRTIIDEDNRNNRYKGRVHTRFPPEPNGYLHIGHAKSICLNFGIAREYNGLCNLRFDDTNPTKEEQEYVDSIKEDIQWLGFTWEDREYYASDYFEILYGYAEKLVRNGKAYVDDLSAEEIREYRGTPTQPGKNSPFRDRSVEENLDLFRRMRAGEFPEGSRILRAKIDMAHPNIHMRDPAMYRIRFASHHRTQNAWCIYPTYDWTHGQSDSIEGITHSICTLEFENHRPLYDWFLDALEIYQPRQIEFARLNLTNTVMSKRKLLELVREKTVSGWDDPRMPTISGFRRKGYTPAAIREFAARIGVAKVNSTVDYAFLEYCLREDLNRVAPRRMAVLDPVKVVITNYPEGKEETFEAENNPENPDAGSRNVPFSREVWIEREDFMEDPPRKYFRLSPGREVRLKYAYYITCKEILKDRDGRITELQCVYDPESRGGGTPDGRKVKGTLHWVSAAHAIDAEVRLYDHLFTLEDPSDIPEGRDWKEFLNPDSLVVYSGCKLEPALSEAQVGTTFQFLRQGYFCPDSRDHSPERPVFNRTTGLRDTWAKLQRQGKTDV
jgi:glutaminyl-tRNA synthetase